MTLKEELDLGNLENNSIIKNYNFVPQINSRQITQFHHGRFPHPIVPLTNLEEGYSSVFTLNLVNFPITEYDFSEWDFYEAKKNLMNNETSTY